MKAIVSCLLVAAVTACAGTEQSSRVPSSPQEERPSGATSRQAVDDPGRPLTTSECESLGQSISETCATRLDSRSAQTEGWCGDIATGVSDGSWITGDCVKHLKYMDSVCFRSASNARALVDCDRAVNRP
jgi:hypothetical protein